MHVMGPLLWVLSARRQYNQPSDYAADDCATDDGEDQADDNYLNVSKGASLRVVVLAHPSIFPDVLGRSKGYLRLFEVENPRGNLIHALWVPSDEVRGSGCQLGGGLQGHASMRASAAR